MRKPAGSDGDRRQQILEAALDVFAEQGFEKATTKEIATRVGVAQGLVYFYFSSKVELLFATCEHQTSLALCRLDACQKSQAKTPQGALRCMLTNFIQVLEEPQTAKLMRIITQIELPEEPIDKGSHNPKEAHVHKMQLLMLYERLYSELLMHLQDSLPGYPDPGDLFFEADFCCGAIISGLIKRARKDLENTRMAQLSQQQFIDGVLSNIFAWIAIKQAILAGSPQT